MVVGLGIDLTPIARIARLLERWGARFEEKVFTEGERRYCRARARGADHYAARFAAKEAGIKALGGAPGAGWHDLEVDSDGEGRPRLVAHGAAREAMAALGATRLLLSLTHDGGSAAAVVIAEAER